MIDFVSIGSSILNGLLDLVMNFVIFIVNILLLPIDAVISSMIPQYTSFTGTIVDSLNVASQYVGYCLDSVGFYSSTIYLFVAYLTIKLTMPAIIWLFKLAVNWYSAIKF